MKRLVSLVLISQIAMLVSAAAERPNVILMNIDNHSKESLGYYGNEFIETPEIDRLFEQEIRFENYHCAGRCIV